MDWKSRFVTLAGREVHYYEWGQENSETVICWHGLARNGRDFDVLARALSDRYRVICPDTIGRGFSEWSKDPEKEYCLDFYERLAAELVSTLQVSAVYWVGTSMGGAIGMRAAAGALKGKIRRLVLNDIGPAIADAAVERILTYAGNPPAFGRISELEAFLRTVYAPFGHLSDEEWRVMTLASCRRLENGRITVHYDPAMVGQFVHHPDDYRQWEVYDSIDVPVLCLRGAESDLLLPETVEEMRRRGPKADIVEIAGVGHAPALNNDEQIGLVANFLNAG